MVSLNMHMKVESESKKRINLLSSRTYRHAFLLLPRWYLFESPIINLKSIKSRWCFAHQNLHFLLYSKTMRELCAAFIVYLPLAILEPFSHVQQQLIRVIATKVYTVTLKKWRSWWKRYKKLRGHMIFWYSCFVRLFPFISSLMEPEKCTHLTFPLPCFCPPNSFAAICFSLKKRYSR